MICMARRIPLLPLSFALSLGFVAAACSSDASNAGDITTAAAAADTTTTTTAAAAPTTDPGTSTTPAPSSPPTTLPPTTAAPPATPAPTVAPSTVACRDIGNLYGLVDVSGVSVRLGDCGEGVQQVQDQLNYKLGITLTVDGLFGPGTQAAVRDFQELVGLPVDGIVGPSTWVALTDDGT